MQMGEVEGQRARRQVELVGDRARGEAAAARLDQQSEYRQPMFLGQGGQRGHGPAGCEHLGHHFDSTRRVEFTGQFSGLAM